MKNLIKKERREVPKPKPYAEAQAEWIALHGITKGMKLRIIQEFPFDIEEMTERMGWTGGWVDEAFREYHGECWRVYQIGVKSQGLHMRRDSDGEHWWMPFQILSPIT